jgi:hypothetical protein
MVARQFAIAATVATGAWLLVAQPPAVEAPVVRTPVIRVYFTEEPPPLFGDARPCLIDTVSCLELSPEPFAPCLTAELERCSQEWRLHQLVGRIAAPQR